MVKVKRVAKSRGINNTCVGDADLRGRVCRSICPRKDECVKYRDIFNYMDKLRTIRNLSTFLVSNDKYIRKYAKWRYKILTEGV